MLDAPEGSEGLPRMQMMVLNLKTVEYSSQLAYSSVFKDEECAHLVYFVNSKGFIDSVTDDLACAGQRGMSCFCHQSANISI